jgi:hypothetical protein
MVLTSLMAAMKEISMLTTVFDAALEAVMVDASSAPDREIEATSVAILYDAAK